MNDAQASTTRRRVILRNRPIVACYLALFIIAFLLTMEAHQAQAFPGDLLLAQWVQSVDFPIYDQVMQLVTRIGFITPSLVILTACALGFWIARRRLEAGFVVLTLTGDALTLLVKLIVARPRPSDDAIAVFQQLNEYSFPSAHVTHFVVFYGFVFYLLRAQMRPSPLRAAALAVPAALLLLVGPSRVYLGAHWPSDVLGAYLLGGLWLAILIEAYSECTRRIGSRSSS